jgi:hypothetical protein
MPQKKERYSMGISCPAFVRWLKSFWLVPIPSPKLELRQGTGAFVAFKRRPIARANLVQEARQRVATLVDDLRRSGLHEDEIQRIFEAELIHPAEVLRK